MEIALAPHSEARIRAVLGATVDLSPGAVPQVLARLAEDAPDVYSQVLSELSGSQIQLDSERTLHRRHRRAALRRAVFGWGEYESEAGDRLLAKRRLAAAAPIGLAAVMLIVGGCSALLHRSHSASAARPAARASRAKPAALELVAEAIPQPSVRQSGTERRRIVGRTKLSHMPAPPPLRPSPQLPPVPALPLPPFPFGREAAGGPPPAIVFNRAVPGDTRVRGADSAPASPVVYARDGAADAPDSPPAWPRIAAGVERPGVRRPGDRLLARLVTGVVVAPGAPPVPVVAEGVTDGSAWLGRAVAGPDDRIQLSFQSADADGSRVELMPPPGSLPVPGTAPLRGVALEPGRLSAGLPGRVVIRRRAAAAAAIGAVFQAASDYAAALAHAGQVTVTDGTEQVSLGAPAPGWTYVAARLAETLRAQASGTIKTVEIPAGTSCVILITEAP